MVRTLRALFSTVRTQTRNTRQRGATATLALRFRPRLLALESRLAPSAMVAYRPQAEHFDWLNHSVVSATPTGAPVGIRMNGDDDDGNGRADRWDSTTAANGDDDLILVRLDLSSTATPAPGTFDQVTLTVGNGNIKLWDYVTKGTETPTNLTSEIGSQRDVWVEYVGASHGDAFLRLDFHYEGALVQSEALRFYSFRTIVVAIGGLDQTPTDSLTNTSQGTFRIAVSLYNQGYDVHMFAQTAVGSGGRGAAYDEVVSAITSRGVSQLGIFGFSWGAGATYNLAAGLNGTTSLKGKYTLSFTAYIDGITQGWISAETRLPPGTRYHVNYYQRKDFLLKGNSVKKAQVNVNVTNTTWGKNLVHTTIDDDPNVWAGIINGLKQNLREPYMTI